MALGQRMGMDGPGEMRPEHSPWILSQIIRQAEILQKTGAELQQYVREQVELNAMLGDGTSNASKYDGLKEHALSNPNINEASVMLRQLKESDLSAGEMNIYLEVLAERCIKKGMRETAELFSREISDDEIRQSIEFQLDK